MRIPRRRIAPPPFIWKWPPSIGVKSHLFIELIHSFNFFSAPINHKCPFIRTVIQGLSEIHIPDLKRRLNMKNNCSKARILVIAFRRSVSIFSCEKNTLWNLTCYFCVTCEGCDIQRTCFDLYLLMLKEELASLKMFIKRVAAEFNFLSLSSLRNVWSFSIFTNVFLPNKEFC